MIISQKFSTARSLQAGLGFVAGAALALSGCQRSQSPVPSERPAETPIPKQKALSKVDTLKAMTAKIADFALQPLDRKWDVEGYAKLGPTVWKTSNDLRRWAGLAALQNDSCKFVDAIAVWEQATQSQLAWHVVCGDERFVISEAQARNVQAQLDPDVQPADQRGNGEPMETVQPMSEAFANFSVARAVVACDNLMKEASVNKGSYDASWSWDEARDEENGRAIISREYEAKNAMGGTLSGKYECSVDAASNRVVGLKARDAFGLHTVL